MIFGTVPDLILLSILGFLIICSITFFILAIVYRKKKYLFIPFLISSLAIIFLLIAMFITVILIISLLYLVVIFGM